MDDVCNEKVSPASEEFFDLVLDHGAEAHAVYKQHKMLSDQHELYEACSEFLDKHEPLENADVAVQKCLSTIWKRLQFIYDMSKAHNDLTEEEFQAVAAQGLGEGGWRKEIEFNEMTARRWCWRLFFRECLVQSSIF